MIRVGGGRTAVTEDAEMLISSAIALTMLVPLAAVEPRQNGHYFAPPTAGENYAQWLDAMHTVRNEVRSGKRGGRPLDDSLYRRGDLRWMTGNFVCGFLFIYDRSFWDPEWRKYRVAALCEEARRDFGGYDSVVLWHAYPRIGADERNQFDFFRDMPGGLAGVRSVVGQFHREGVKVFVPYNPWDTGTRREGESDEAALARLVAAIEADGIFLDTMAVAPGQLRAAVDIARPGVAFEPEGHPALAEIERASGSWAQWLNPYPGIGVLWLKWIEPRHIQHQIRRWDKSHRDELAAAWLNGSGVLVWENIFGYWNPWSDADRRNLRRMAPILRRFASHFSEGRWLPCFPTRKAGVYASCWEKDGVRLWTLWNTTGRRVDDAVLELEPRGETFFDLWRGGTLKPHSADGKIQIPVALDEFGAIAAVAPTAKWTQVAPPLDVVSDMPRWPTRPVLEPQKPPACPVIEPSKAMGMLKVDGGRRSFSVRHARRECGCYPDPGTPSQAWERFLIGTPHEQTLEHRIETSVEPCFIDARPVTNGQFEAFLRATGYRPRCRDKFLAHWGGTTCPEKLRNEPVVYVDLDDARAYAAHAGRRLPTEWEWQAAAEQHGGAFDRATVREWTESCRDDGHCRFVLLRGGCRYQAKGSIWYFPGGEQPIESHLKFLLLDGGLDRCSTIGFRCLAPAAPTAVR